MQAYRLLNIQNDKEKKYKLRRNKNPSTKEGFLYFCYNHRMVPSAGYLETLTIRIMAIMIAATPMIGFAASNDQKVLMPNTAKNTVSHKYKNICIY